MTVLLSLRLALCFGAAAATGCAQSASKALDRQELVSTSIAAAYDQWLSGEGARDATLAVAMGPELVVEGCLELLLRCAQMANERRERHLADGVPIEVLPSEQAPPPTPEGVVGFVPVWPRRNTRALEALIEVRRIRNLPDEPGGVVEWSEFGKLIWGSSTGRLQGYSPLDLGGPDQGLAIGRWVTECRKAPEGAVAYILGTFGKLSLRDDEWLSRVAVAIRDWKGGVRAGSNSGFLDFRSRKLYFVGAREEWLAALEYCKKTADVVKRLRNLVPTAEKDDCTRLLVWLLTAEGYASACKHRVDIGALADRVVAASDVEASVQCLRVCATLGELSVVRRDEAVGPKSPTLVRFTWK